MTLTVEALLSALQETWESAIDSPGMSIMVSPAMADRIRKMIRYGDIKRSLFGKRQPTIHQLRKIRFPQDLTGLVKWEVAYGR